MNLNRFYLRMSEKSSTFAAVFEKTDDDDSVYDIRVQVEFCGEQFAGKSLDRPWSYPCQTGRTGGYMHHQHLLRDGHCRP